MTLLAWKPENQAVVAAVGVVTLFLVFISLRKSKSTKLKYHGIRSFPELRIEPKTFIQRLLPPAARMDDILGVLHTMVLDKEGDNVPVCRLGDNILFLNSYPVIREVLVAGQSNYSKCLNSVDRGPGITGLALWVFLRGDHLGGTVNEEWTWRRHALQPSFQPRKIVPQLLGFTIARTQQLVRHISDISNNGMPLDIDELIMNLTGAIMCKYIFGFADEELDASDIGDISQVSEMFRILLDDANNPLQFVPFLRSIPILRAKHLETLHRLRAFSKKAVDQCLAAFPAKSIPILDSEEAFVPLCARLAATREEFKGDEGVDRLAHECLILIFAGSDTTSHTAAFALGELARNREVADKIARETFDVFQTQSIMDLIPEDVKPESLSMLRHTNSVIRETLRYYPGGVMVSYAAKTDTEVAGRRVPAGTLLNVNIAGVLRDPKIYAEPERYHPSRWLEDDPNTDLFTDTEAAGKLIENPGKNSNGREVWRVEQNAMPDLAFSVGPKACIGRNLALLELKALISLLSAAFVTSLPEGETLEPKIRITMKPKREAVMINWQVRSPSLGSESF